MGKINIMQEKITNPEEKFYKYTYVDKLDKNREVFGCTAKNILEADKNYEAATGKDPRKQTNIACSFEPAEAEKEKDLAEEYEKTAIRLEDFISSYTPAGWEEPIGKVMHRFHFLAQDIAEMTEDYKRGLLKDKLDKKYKNPNVVSAIMDFFAK